MIAFLRYKLDYKIKLEIGKKNRNIKKGRATVYQKHKSQQEKET